MIKQAPIALLALLGTAVVVTYAGLNAYKNVALPAAAAGQCYAFELAAATYKEKTNQWPPTGSNAETVAALMGNPKTPSAKREDYLALTTYEHNVPLFVEPDPPGSDNYVALDVWNQPFRFEIVGDDLRVTSSGADEIFGTADDISSDAHPNPEN